jgi:hypothetical protein
MGVEHGGSPSQNRDLHRNTVDHADGARVRHTLVPETRTAQSPEGNGAVPVTVVSRAELEELQRQLEDAQAKAAKYDHQRELARARDEKWRKSHPDEVKRRTRERVAAHRARQRQAGR